MGCWHCRLQLNLVTHTHNSNKEVNKNLYKNVKRRSTKHILLVLQSQYYAKMPNLSLITSTHAYICWVVKIKLPLYSALVIPTTWYCPTSFLFSTFVISSALLSDSSIEITSPLLYCRNHWLNQWDHEEVSNTSAFMHLGIGVFFYHKWKTNSLSTNPSSYSLMHIFLYCSVMQHKQRFFNMGIII